MCPKGWPESVAPAPGAITDVNLIQYLGVACGPANPVDTDPVDRAARLLGIIYGTLGQINQVVPADALAPGNALSMAGFNFVYNGATWDMVREGATAGSVLTDPVPVKDTTQTHNAVALNADSADFASAEVDCSLFRKFLLGYDLTEMGVLVNGDRVRLRIQFREAAGTWRDYMIGPYGALFEEESTTPCSLCVSGDAIGERIRLVATTDYTNVAPANNHFVLSSYITLMR